jgi:hypothetical protein
MGTLLIWKRISFFKGVVVLIISGFFTVIVNLCRLLIIGIVGRQNPLTAETLEHIPALPAMVGALLLSLLFTRKFFKTAPVKEEL